MIGVPMEVHEYERMRELEERHWWYRSLHEFVLARLGNAGRVLDVGCGTGGMLASLAERHAIGVDLSPIALAYAGRRGLTTLVRASACALPFPDASFDAILALDLLYHRQVADEKAAVQECRRVARPGGIIMIHASAYSWLFGTHDRAVHGARRHTASRIRQLVSAAGLEITELSYRNALALPFALLARGCGRLRRAERSGSAPASDLRPLPRWLNSLALLGARTENAWLRVGALPVGLSVWCVARRP